MNSRGKFLKSGTVFHGFTGASFKITPLPPLFHNRRKLIKNFDLVSQLATFINMKIIL